MQAQGHFGNLHCKSVVALSFLFLAHASSPAVRGSHQLPWGGDRTLAGQGHEGQRRVKRWLFLLLRLAHSRDARREVGELERRTRRIGRSQGPNEILSCTCRRLLSQAHPSRSRRCHALWRQHGNCWVLTGQSESLCETCSRTSPVGKEWGVEGAALDLLGSEGLQSTGNLMDPWPESSTVSECVSV